MRLTNETGYDSKVLRKIICATHNHMAKVEGRLRTWKGLDITVEYSRRRGCNSGWASYNGYRMMLRFFKPSRYNRTKVDGEWLNSRVRVRAVVWLVYHELMHSYGYRHKQYTDIKQPEVLQVCTALGMDPDLWVPEKAPTPKLKRDLPLDRYKRLCDREVEWETKEKRAATFLKKLRSQKKQYERRLRAAGKLEE